MPAAHAIIYRMKIAAIITEYNPFHNGHAYQIRAVREHFGHDCAIMVVMSGCFTQRGEPALLDKWTRTRAAIACGVDLVIELPFAYATASAERFADGAVALFKATGLKASLVFGSESGNLPLLRQAASLLVAEPDEFRLLLRDNLDLGLSFPDARQKALAVYTGDEQLADLLSSSNNILAIEYLKAIERQEAAGLSPFTIRRLGQAYKEENLDAATALFASARAIRTEIAKNIRPGQTPDYYDLIRNLSSQMPASSLAELLVSLQDGPGILFPESFAPMIISRIRAASGDKLADTPGMGEGLGQRLRGAAARLTDRDSSFLLQTLVAGTATRRFPRTRVQRAVIALLAGVTNDDYALFDAGGGPQYLRILGFNRRGRYLLKLMRKLAEKPVLTRASDFAEYGSSRPFQRMAELDILASDMWMLTAGRACGDDFDTPVYMR